MIASHYPIDTFWFDIILYLLIGVLAPLVLMLCCWGIGTLLHRRKAGLRMGIVVGVATMLTALYGFTYGMSQVHVRHVTLAFDDLPADFDGYRILHIGDLHVGTYRGWRTDILKTVVDSAMAQRVDMVAFTGDLQNARPYELLGVLSQLRRIKAPDGVYSVLGNHDYPMYLRDVEEYEKVDSLARHVMLQRDSLGWTLLCNGYRWLHRGKDSIVVSGMENDGEPPFPQYANLTNALYGVPAHGSFIVMLEHDPTSWRRTILPHSHTQLTLSGHTHGGQLALLGLSPAQLRYRESRGHYQIGKQQLYVTSGVGGLLPCRIGVVPEMVVITLKRSDKTTE
jgi:hypothetical protein